MRYPLQGTRCPRRGTKPRWKLSPTSGIFVSQSEDPVIFTGSPLPCHGLFPRRSARSLSDSRAARANRCHRPGRLAQVRPTYPLPAYLRQRENSDKEVIPWTLQMRVDYFCSCITSLYYRLKGSKTHHLSAAEICIHPLPFPLFRV